MQARWTIVLMLSTLAPLADDRNLHSTFAVENAKPAPAVARNPLRDTGTVRQPEPTVEGDFSAVRSNLLAQLQADLKGSDPARAILAIHRLEKYGAMGAAILAQSLAAPNQPLEIEFPTLNSLTAIGPAAVPALLELLESPQDSERTRGWIVLGRLGPHADAATPALIKILINTAAVSDDRESAARILGQIGPAARDALSLLLETAERNEQDELQLACLGAMRLIGGITPDHNARLVRLLLKEEVEASLRVTAASVLVEQSPPPLVVLPALIGFLQHEDDSYVCISAAQALSKIGPSAAEAVPALIRLFDDERTDVRLAAIAACAAMDSAAREAVPALLRQIQDDNYQIQEAAARALVEIDLDSVNTLVSDLRGGDTKQRCALTALHAIGPSGRVAVPQLLRMLTDSATSEARQAIVKVLRGIGPDAAAAVPQLSTLLRNTDQPVEIRVEAALALGAVSSESAADLLAALRDQESTVRIAAAQALAMQNTLERSVIPVLVRELADANSDAAAAALVEMGEEAIPSMRKLALDQDAEVEQRCWACLILGRISHATAADLVQVFTGSQDKLAEAAEQALFEIGPSSAVPALLDALQEYETATSLARPSTFATVEPEVRAASIERMQQLIVDMSGGLGGSGGGAASAPMVEATFGMEDEAMAGPTSAPPPQQPAPAARARGADMSAPAPAGGSSAPPPPAKIDLKIVKVFYGTNRRPVATTAERLWFAWRGFIPAIAMGGATILVCGISFARSRSPLAAVLAGVGVVATLCLTFPASQQLSDSARSITRRPGPVYGGDHSDQLELGMCEVTIPANHRAGELESPSIERGEFDQDPRKHITLRDVVRCGEEQFHVQVKKNLAEKGNNILVFVHGYNVDFDDAARRTAQLACDLEFAGAPLFFSWPSQGNWYEYREDEKQVELSVTLLKQFLLSVAARSKATSIHLIAHSMGSRALTAALKEIESASEQHSTQFNQVVLAAPDIDADVFRQRIAPAIVNKAQRVTLYANSNDLALTASRTFNSGDLRAGDTSRGLVLTPGIETIDVTGIDTSLLGHSYYGDSPTVLTDLKELLTSAHSADQRPYLQPMALDRLRYWVFQHPTIASQPMNSTIR